MKRYVALVFILMIVVITKVYMDGVRNYNTLQQARVEIDSLRQTIFFYESTLTVTKKNQDSAQKEVKTRIEAHDSAIQSHDQQIRWLQWHVEQLKSNLNH